MKLISSFKLLKCCFVFFRATDCCWLLLSTAELTAEHCWAELKNGGKMLESCWAFLRIAECWWALLTCWKFLSAIEHCWVFLKAAEHFWECCLALLNALSTVESCCLLWNITKPRCTLLRPATAFWNVSRSQQCLKVLKNFFKVSVALKNAQQVSTGLSRGK